MSAFWQPVQILPSIANRVASRFLILQSIFDIQVYILCIYIYICRFARAFCCKTNQKLPPPPIKRNSETQEKKREEKKKSMLMFCFLIKLIEQLYRITWSSKYNPPLGLFLSQYFIPSYTCPSASFRWIKCLTWTSAIFCFFLTLKTTSGNTLWWSRSCLQCMRIQPKR